MPCSRSATSTTFRWTVFLTTAARSACIETAGDDQQPTAGALSWQTAVLQHAANELVFAVVGRASVLFAINTDRSCDAVIFFDDTSACFLIAMSILNGTHYKESVLAIGTVWTQSIATYHARDDW